MSNSPLKCSGVARVNEGAYSFTCHPHVYPQVEWTIPALLPSCRASPHCGRYTFSVPLRVGGWVSLSGWLQVEVTHPSTNRARHTLTSLIETNALPLNQAAGKDEASWWLSLVGSVFWISFSALILLVGCQEELTARRKPVPVVLKVPFLSRWRQETQVRPADAGFQVHVENCR